MYREGPNGLNIPYGNYKNPNIIDYDNIISISKLIQNVIFIQSDFEKSFKNIKNKDFVYF